MGHMPYDTLIAVGLVVVSLLTIAIVLSFIIRLGDRPKPPKIVPEVGLEPQPARGRKTGRQACAASNPIELSNQITNMRWAINR